jgi:hypothetical protein
LRQAWEENANATGNWFDPPPPQPGFKDPIITDPEAAVPEHMWPAITTPGGRTFKFNPRDFDNPRYVLMEVWPEPGTGGHGEGGGPTWEEVKIGYYGTWVYNGIKIGEDLMAFIEIEKMLLPAEEDGMYYTRMRVREHEDWSGAKTGNIEIAEQRAYIEKEVWAFSQDLVDKGFYGEGFQNWTYTVRENATLDQAKAQQWDDGTNWYFELDHIARVPDFSHILQRSDERELLDFLADNTFTFMGPLPPVNFNRGELAACQTWGDINTILNQYSMMPPGGAPMNYLVDLGWAMRDVVEGIVDPDSGGPGGLPGPGPGAGVVGPPKVHVQRVLIYDWDTGEATNIQSIGPYSRFTTNASIVWFYEEYTSPSPSGPASFEWTGFHSFLESIIEAPYSLSDLDFPDKTWPDLLAITPYYEPGNYSNGPMDQLLGALDVAVKDAVMAAGLGIQLSDIVYILLVDGPSYPPPMPGMTIFGTELGMISGFSALDFKLSDKIVVTYNK